MEVTYNATWTVVKEFHDDIAYWIMRCGDNWVVRPRRSVAEDCQRGFASIDYEDIVEWIGQTETYDKGMTKYAEISVEFGIPFTKSDRMRRYYQTH